MGLKISLAMIVRDEAHCVDQPLQSVRRFVDEFVFVDTGSSDGTYDLCSVWNGRGVKIQTDRNTFDFGAWKTVVSWMCRGDYILLLDADEVLTGAERLRETAEWLAAHRAEFDAVAFPRRRWMDRAMTRRVEESAWPDWQARLYINEPDMRWRGALHEKLSGNHHKMPEPIVIEHFQDVYHLADPERARMHVEQRRTLAEIAGVPMEGSEEALRLASRTLSSD